ncbi:hypothetical protein YC2023_104868 [Brassica napus]
MEIYKKTRTVDYSLAVLCERESGDSYGKAELISLEELKDESNGYFVKDTIVLEATHMPSLEPSIVSTSHSPRSLEQLNQTKRGRLCAGETLGGGNMIDDDVATKIKVKLQVNCLVKCYFYVLKLKLACILIK